MSTASFALAQSIPIRIQELRILTQKAKEIESKEEELYNAICRSTCVLLVSHLEGFLKDLSRSLVADLNYHLGVFSRMPKAMQRTFCQKIAFYEGVSNDEIDTRISQLLNFFNNNSVSIDLNAFSYKENSNKNPSSGVIDSALERLGVPNVLSSIAKPAFEAVFLNDERMYYKLNRDMKRLISHLYFFPYKPMNEPYLPTWRKYKVEKGRQTLWHTFVEDILNRRHTIAHGDTSTNETSWEELHRDSEKLRVLMYGILFSATLFLGQRNT